MLRVHQVRCMVGRIPEQTQLLVGQAYTFLPTNRHGIAEFTVRCVLLAPTWYVNQYFAP